MSMQEVTRSTEMPLAIRTLRDDLHKMEEQFRFALPPHIPPARFIRVCMTAVQNQPKLIACTRQSFFNACMKCAQDGLLPDGREAALVPYGETEDGQKGSDIAQYMPMIMGIRKKVRNSGLLSDWNVQVVQEGDEFDYQLGDSPFITHKPAARGGRARPVLFAYSIATYPDGTKSREVMNIDQLKDIQSKSKARRGPWSDPIFYPEMCRKTVARLHSKQLPMSTDLDRLMHADDALYDFAGARQRADATAVRPPPTVAAALDQFGAAGGEPQRQVEDQNKGRDGGDQADTSQQETTSSSEREGQTKSEQTTSRQAGSEQTRSEPSGSASAAPPARTPEEIEAHRKGQEDKAKGHTRKAVPGEYREPNKTALANAWLKGHDNEAL